jgi:hypothetical protein
MGKIKNFNNKKIGICLVIATYVFLLIAFLITAIVGLDRRMWQYSGEPNIIEIGLYKCFMFDSDDISPFTLNSKAIVSVVFMSLAVVLFVGTLLIVRKQINIFYLTIPFILIVAFIITMLTSKPVYEEAQENDMIG